MLSFGEADVLLQKYASIPTGLTFTRRLWQYGQIFVYMLLLRLFDFEGAFFVGHIEEIRVMAHPFQRLADRPGAVVMALAGAAAEKQYVHFGTSLKSI